MSQVARIKAALSARRVANSSPPADDLGSSDTPGERHKDQAVPEVAMTSSPEFDRAVPIGVQNAASWAWRVLLIAALIGGIGWMVRYLSEVIIPLSIATLLAALIFPVTNRLRQWGVPKAVAALLSVVGGLALILGAFTLIGTQIASQAGELSDQVVSGFGQLVAYVKSSGLPVNQSWFQLDQWGTKIQKFLVDSRGTITTYAAEISAQVGHFLAGLAITLFSLFYFLYDGRGIWTFLLRFFPRHSRRQVDAAARKGWTSLSAYVRATILVALSDAIGVLIVALILGVPLAPALAALVFLGAFVPLIGAFVSGFVAVIVALVALGLVPALIMLAGIVAVMQIEGHILQPFLLGRAVKLHPLAVLIAIAVGIIVGGIVGALMSVPLLAFSKTFVQSLSRMPEEELVVDPLPSKAPSPAKA